MNKKVKLKDALKNAELFIDGDWIESKDQDQNGDIRLIQLADIGNGKYLNKSSRFMTLEKAEKLKCTFIKKGDILLARMPEPLGRSCLFLGDEKPCVTVVDICIIRPDKTINSSYLNHQINSSFVRNQINNYITGTTRKRISRSNLGKVEILLPSLEKQKQIAKTLDKANELIELRKESITKLDALSKSIFIDMFGDPLSKDIKKFELLGTIANIVMGQSPNGDSYNDKGLGEPLLNGPTEFGKKYPKEKQYTTNPKKFSKYGDILFCVRGATAGKLNYSDKKYCIGRGLASISSKSKYSNSYLFYLLEYHYDYFQKTSNGSTFINICKDDLFNLKVPISNEDLQNKFAKIIEKIEEQKSLYEKELEKLQINFDALLQKSFQE